MSPATARELSAILKQAGLKPTGDVHALELATVLDGERRPLSRVVKPPPWDHQVEAAHRIGTGYGVYFHGGMGTGKTRSVIDATVNYGLRRTLILCPSSVVLNWLDEFGLYAAAPVKVVALSKGGTIAKRTARAQVQAEMCDATGEHFAVVINYEAAWRDPFASWAKGRQWDLVVLDEVHKIKSPDGKASTFCGELRASAARAVGLSGTPMPHGPLDVFGQYRALDPSVFGSSVTRFKIKYQTDFDTKMDPRARAPEPRLQQTLDRVQLFRDTWTMRRGEGKSDFAFDLSLAVQMIANTWTDQEIVDGLIFHRRTIRHKKFAGRGHLINVMAAAKKMRGVPVTLYKDLADLRRRMDTIRYEVNRDVLDLPEAIPVKRYVELSREELRVHNDIFEAFTSEIDAGRVTAANALVRLLKLQQAICGYAKTDEGDLVQIGKSRQDALCDLFEDLGVPGGEPVVVFCRFRPDLDAVHRAAEAAGKESLELSGRRSEWQTWQKDPEAPPVLAVQIQAGGLGVNLTRSRYSVFYSLGYSLGDYEQALARIHRPGQGRKCTHVHLISQGTVDEHVYKALQDKADVVEFILSKLGDKSKR